MSTWYKDWFADPRYTELYKHRDVEDAERMVTLIENTIGRDTNRSILDIPCGAGRHLLAFANRGYGNLTGLDLSTQLINLAKQSAASHRNAINYRVADMRDRVTGKFDLVLNLFTSFGYFDSEEDNKLAINNITSAVTSGGYFILDFLNSDSIRSLTAAEQVIERDGIGRVIVRKRINNDRIIKHIVFESDGSEFIESVRLYTKDELSVMLMDCGLTLVQLYGDYTGSEYSGQSPRVIIFARNEK